MQSRKKYDRSFILLQPESGGFALEGRKLTGTALLEIINGKGKATVNIQWLKTPSAGVCKMYLISSKDGGALGVCLGDIIPGAGGKSSNVWEFDPDNVGGCGLSYDEFNVIAAILKGSDISQNEIITPLAGYKNGVVIWKSGFREYNAQTARSAANEEPEAVNLKNFSENESENPQESDETGTSIISMEDEKTHPSDAPFAALSDKLINSLSSDELGLARKVHEKLKETVPEEKCVKLMNSLATIADYAPASQRDRLTLLLTEAAGLTPNIPFDERDPLNELLSDISEYIPGKVKETAGEVFEDVAAHIPGGELNRFSAILKKCAVFCKAETTTEEPEKAVYENIAFENMTSGKVTSENMASEPELRYYNLESDDSAVELAETTVSEAAPEAVVRPGEQSGLSEKLMHATSEEDYNAKFRERLREFAERFDSIENRQFERGSEEKREEPAMYAERLERRPDDRDRERHGGKYEERRPEHGAGRGKYDEEKLFRLFDTRKGFEPFRFSGRPEHGKPGFPGSGPGFPGAGPGFPGSGPGFPPVVPPSIPIYDIRWVQITPDDVYLLPERFWLYAGNTFVSGAYRRYGHLILGFSGRGARRVCYLGVPGMYSERDRIRAASLGFTSFMPVNGGTPRQGEFGYWIMECR